jgi:hypothetical protein
MRTVSCTALLLCLAGAAAAQTRTIPEPPAPSIKPVPGGAIEAAFKRADANGDGKVSQAEAARMPAIAEKFAQNDRNGDGALDQAEFLAGYSP